MPIQAVPGVGTILTRGGRKVYRDLKGRFTSKAKFELEMRRGPGGTFITRAAGKRQRGVESYLRYQLGAPPAGKTWSQIASKYAERFADYLADLDE